MCDTHDTTVQFAQRPSDKVSLEVGSTFSPKFDDNGMIPCIAQHAETGEVLMFAFMNDIALAKTIETGKVHYWSRSRDKLWLKGESSGMSQHVVQLLTDCDQDVILARVTIGVSKDGSAQASCHVGYANCFYRAIETPSEDPANAKLDIVQDKVYDPDKVYGK